MADSKLLGTLPNRRIIRHVEDGRQYVETREDEAQFANLAKILSEEKPGKDFTRVAIIPSTVIDRAFNEGWFHDPDAWRKWANDPANKHLRTTEGTI